MAKLEIIEGFDHVGSAATNMSRLDDKSAAGTKGWSSVGLTDTDQTPVTGRDGVGLAMRQSGSTDQQGFDLSTPIEDAGSLGVLCGGFALRLNYEPSDHSTRTTVFGLRTLSGSTQCALVVNRNGGIGMTFGTSTTTSPVRHMTSPAGAAPPMIKANTWHYIQFIFYLPQSLASGLGTGWQIWLDRQLAIDTTQDGKQSWGNSSNLEEFFFIHNHTFGTKDIDDFWLSAEADKTDPVGINPGPNRFTVIQNRIRDPQVRIQFPTGDGATTAWTPDAGTHFSSVDEDPEDGDTTYIDSSLAADVDLFTFPAVGADVTDVPATMVSFTSRETVATGFSVNARTRHSTNEATTGTAVDTSTSTSFETKQARARRSVGTTPSDITVTLTNPGAESAVDPPTGWTAVGDVTVEQGAQNSGTPPASAQAGTWWFYFDGGTTATGGDLLWLEQEVTTATDAVPAADIDNGNLQVEVTGFCYQSTNDDAVIQCIFKDADGATIATFTSPDYTPGAVWTTQTYICHVPSGTRSVAYRIGGKQLIGSSTVGIWWDSISIVFAYLDNTDEFTTTQIDAAEFGVITA